MKLFGFFGPRATAEDRREIATIAETGAVRSLADLLRFLPPSAHPLGGEAAAAAERVLERVAPSELAWFDGSYRSGYAPKGEPAPVWDELSPNRIGDSRGTIALASFHRSGFVREAAVHRLAAMTDGFEVPFLVVRANDWVSVIQAAAMRALKRRLDGRYVQPLARSLDLLDRSSAERTRHRRELLDFRDRVEALLATPDGAGELRGLLTTGTLAQRRAAVRIASRMSPPESRALLARAMREPDPIVAIRAAEALLAQRPSLEAAERTELIRHRFAAVRANALATLADEGEIRHALLDPSRAVREMARYLLEKRGSGSDFSKTYREALNVGSPTSRLAALEGLAELGDESDLGVFRAFAKRSSAPMRAAAVRGLARVGGTNERDALFEALHDPSSLVRRAARPYVKRLFGRLAART